jgi:acetyltransferase
VAGLASGSGDTLWRALELQRELEKTWEGSPFEVVAVVCDSPDSKCASRAKDLGIPCETVDIRDFYAKRDVPMKDRAARADYDRLILERLAKYSPSMLLLAGYVWATTDVITRSITTAGVHPADLSVMRDGRRAYAGADGIGSSLAGGERALRASSYLATPVIDGGPILIISPAVQVGNDGLEGKERTKLYLGPVNEQGRLVGARTVLEIANGRFGTDAEGQVYYREEHIPDGLKFESWDENLPLHERSMEALMSPRSIAVIGASARPSLGNGTLKNIVDGGFKGKLWAVNRNGEDVHGAKGYSSVAELPETPDLALVTVPGGVVVEIARQCGDRGVKAMAVLSSGFREIGGEGVEFEKKLMETVNRHNMRLLGPNCMGLINSDEAVSLNANMLQVTPRRGGVSFITQSGAIGSALIDLSESLGIGFSMIASTGNQPDVTMNDLIPLMAEDRNTSVIIAYLETIPDPGRFVRVVRKASELKPVVIVKSGRTAVGARAASSHTGSLAGDSAIAESLIEKSNAIRAASLEEMFMLASALSNMRRFSGNRVGVISNAGGPGTLIADALSESGFALPLLPEETRNELASKLMPQASTGNPLDLVATAPPEHYAVAADYLINSGLYDALILMVVPPVGVDSGSIGEAVAGRLSSGKLPVVSCFFGTSAGAGGKRVMTESGIPTFKYPEQTVEVLRLMRSSSVPYAPALEGGESLLCRMAEIREMTSREGYLPQDDCRRLLDMYGLPIVRQALLSDEDNVGSLGLTYPVVAKIDHPDIVHKSDVGGVVLNIGGPEDLRSTVGELLRKFGGARSVLVQEQVRPGIELILGVNSDPNLGRILLAGMGGTGVEIHRDVAAAHVPFGREKAMSMLRSLRSWPVLEGYRGRPGVDTDTLTDMMCRLQRLLLDVPAVKELDLNPVIWDGERFIIADFRIRTGAI